MVIGVLKLKIDMLGILNETRINEVLEKGVVGRLGYTDGRRIFIIPISYFL
jgi:nitroimidazol reductase NimA-like FMN-containing flavoprotein (pyridoxamine 5'-phosphate oxidase superfamily)